MDNKEKGGNISNISSFVFDNKKHSDNECLVCERKSGRPAKSVKIVASVETFDIEEAAKNLDSTHLLTAVYRRINILECLEI